MEAECGQQADDASRHALGCFGKGVVLRDAGTDREVDSSANVFQDARFGEPLKLGPRDAPASGLS
jgi:hypothetical protein